MAAAVSLSTTPAPLPFDFPVRVGSPTLTASATGFLEGDPESPYFIATALRITDKATGRALQEFRLDETFIRPDPDWAETDDLDFDGWRDLVITLDGGSGGLHYLASRYDPRRGRFREPVRLDNIEPDPKRRVVGTSWRFGWCCGWEEELRFTPDRDEPVVLRRFDRSRADGGGTAGYINGIEKLAAGAALEPVILTVEEPDAKGRMRVVCMAELDEGALLGEGGKPIARMLAGKRAKCGPYAED